MLKTLVGALLLALAGCTAQIRNVEHAPIHDVRSISAATDTILIAGHKQGWDMRVVEPGRIKATLNIKNKHEAVVDILYTPQEYSIMYVDSTNLRYQPTSHRIHRNYNIWVGKLSEEILATSQLTAVYSGQPSPPQQAAPQPSPTQQAAVQPSRTAQPAAPPPTPPVAAQPLPMQQAAPQPSPPQQAAAQPSATIPAQVQIQPSPLQPPAAQPAPVAPSPTPAQPPVQQAATPPPAVPQVQLPVPALQVEPALGPSLTASPPPSDRVREKRVALVIGNGAYVNSNPLPNPANDSMAVAAALRRLGFVVIESSDQDKAGMQALLRRFAAELRGAHASLFYYAGHGLQVQRNNYLVPIDAALESEIDLPFETVAVEVVINLMEQTTSQRLVFLDACRDNPLARRLARSAGASRAIGVGEGLARMNSRVGTLIAFATEPDKVALDGNGVHSPFTQGLLEHMETPGLEIRQMLSRVRATVIQETSGQQLPLDTSALIEDFYLVDTRS